MSLFSFKGLRLLVLGSNTSQIGEFVLPFVVQAI